MRTESYELPRNQSRRIEYAVSQLAGLTPGLTKAPLGLAFSALAGLLLWAGQAELWRTVWPLWLVHLTLVGIAFATALSVVALRTRYCRRFGRVSAPAPKTGDLKAGPLAFGLVGAFLAMAFLNVYLESRLPFSFPALLTTVCFATSSYPRWKVAPHWPAFWTLMAVASLFATHPPAGGDLLDVWFPMVVGFGFALLSAVDHLLLVRILPDLPKEEGPTTGEAPGA